MLTHEILSIAGALSGTVGSGITAFSVNRILGELHFAERALAVTIQGLATNQQDIPIFTGTDARFKNAVTHGSKLVWTGVALLALGFILQAASVLAK